MKLQLTELQEDITAVLNYCYDDELKDLMNGITIPIFIGTRNKNWI